MKSSFFPFSNIRFQHKSEKKPSETHVRAFGFDQSGHVTENDHHVPIDGVDVTYVQVIGLSDKEKINTICQAFDIDPLIIEDILHVPQRNKIEVSGDDLFVCLHVLHDEDDGTREDYLSMYVNGDTLISFHDDQPDYLSEAVKNMHTFVEQTTYDARALFLVLLDMVTDLHIKAHEATEDAIMTYEADLFKEGNDPSEELLYGVRKRVLTIKNNVTPVATQLEKRLEVSKLLFAEGLRPYGFDLLDHLKRLEQKSLESREILQNMIDVHEAHQANRMNKIMTMLTLFSAIFIPLSFLTGFFGMNFVHFGILTYEYAVSLFIGLCLAIGIGMILFFRWKRWL